VSETYVSSTLRDDSDVFAIATSLVKLDVSTITGSVALVTPLQEPSAIGGTYIPQIANALRVDLVTLTIGSCRRMLARASAGGLPAGGR
jgi:hypothetical protein